MASSILSFPIKSAEAPYTRPTLAEVSFHRARFGLHLCDRTSTPFAPASPSFELPKQAGCTAGRIDVEIAKHVMRDRKRRLAAK